MVFTVYISYSRENEEIINSLYSILKQNGISIYIFQTDYVSNLAEHSVSENVKGFIRSSDCVLLFLTERSVRSANIQWEIDTARALGRTVILITEPGIEIPKEYRNLPYIVLDKKRPDSTLQQIKQLSLDMKSKRERGNAIVGILALLAALGIILYIASDQR